MRSLIPYIVCVFILHGRPCIAETLISNIEAAIVSNIESHYGRGTALNATEFLRFSEDVVPFKKSDRDQGKEACEYKTISEACSSTTKYAYCERTISETCKESPFPWNIYTDPSGNIALKNVFPALVFQRQNATLFAREGEDENGDKGHSKTPRGAVWGYGLGFSVLLALISMEGSCMVPCMKRRFFQRILMYCVGLGVGTMACAGTLVLIPEALSLTGEDSPAKDYHFKMTACLCGLYIFYTCSRLKKMWQLSKTVKSRGGPVGAQQVIAVTDNLEMTLEENEQDKRLFPDSYPDDDYMAENAVKPKNRRKVAPVAWIILFGDGFHKFIDGVSVGAAFTESFFAGISVALAVICEEIPHELGDIALLLNAGMSAKRALLYNELVVIPSFVGVTMGILLGENTDASTWILAVAGGIFIYISFVDMLPEMTEQAHKAIEAGTESPLVIFVLQNFGLLTGFIIIFLLAHFGGDIGKLIE